MANYNTSSGYVPKMSDDEAYEKLSFEVRKALQDALQPWSAYHCLKFQKKNGIEATIKYIRDGDNLFMKKGFIPARGRRHSTPSTYVECRVEPLRANW